MGHKVRVLREEEKGTISWKVKFRNGKEKNFVSPITTKPWGKHIPKITELETPNKEALDSQLLCFEPDSLKVETGLPEIEKERFKQGVYY
jgi:adenylylsulfate reductase subunit B